MLSRWTWILVLSLALGLVACGKKEEQKEQAPAQPTTPEQPAAPQPAEPPATGE